MHYTAMSWTRATTPTPCIFLRALRYPISQHGSLVNLFLFGCTALIFVSSRVIEKAHRSKFIALRSRIAPRLPSEDSTLALSSELSVRGSQLSVHTANCPAHQTPGPVLHPWARDLLQHRRNPRSSPYQNPSALHEESKTDSWPGIVLQNFRKRNELIVF